MSMIRVRYECGVPTFAWIVTTREPLVMRQTTLVKMGRDWSGAACTDIEDCSYEVRSSDLHVCSKEYQE